MKLNPELIHKICNLQHKIMVCQIYLKDSTGMYTKEQFCQMMTEFVLRTKMDKYKSELDKVVETLNLEDVSETFSDREFLQQPENKFTFEMQKEATKEVIGRALTLEEIMQERGII